MNPGFNLPRQNPPTAEKNRKN